MRRVGAFKAKTCLALLLSIVIFCSIIMVTVSDSRPANAATFGIVESLIWLDLNGNGVADDGAGRVDGVTVNLYRKEADNSKTLIGTQVSGPSTIWTGLQKWPSGHVGWDGLPQNEYHILEMIVPAGYVASGPGSIINAGAGCWRRCDFFLTPMKPAPKLDGYKFKDMNENGQIDAGEQGIPGVTITLNGNAQTDVTDDYGCFSFAVEAGSYTVAVDESTATGYNPTTATSLAVTLADGEEKTLCFGNAPCGSVSGTKYNDANRNGCYDAGELGVAGVTIKLTGVTTSGEPVALETTTDGNGNYSFTNLKAGQYTVKEVVPCAWTATSLTSIQVTLEGLDVSGVDFNNIPTCLLKWMRWWQNWGKC